MWRQWLSWQWLVHQLKERNINVIRKYSSENDWLMAWQAYRKWH